MSRRTPSLTAEEIRALPASVDMVTACRAFGISRGQGYQLARNGKFPIPVLRLGNTYRFNTADICRALGIHEEATP